MIDHVISLKYFPFFDGKATVIDIRGSFNKSLENPIDGARSIENGFVLISIITH